MIKVLEKQLLVFCELSRNTYIGNVQMKGRPCFTVPIIISRDAVVKPF